MNYKKIYDDLMEQAKDRVGGLDIIEKHHITPKSLGGNNKKSNIVDLSLREHFIAHKLLTKIYKDIDVDAHKKMIYAFWFMCKNHPLREVKARDYETARLLFSRDNPNKCEKRKRIFRENHKAGKYKYDYKKVSASLKETLLTLSESDMDMRLENSLRKCDHITRGKAIQRGKASLLKMTKNAEVIKFWSYDSVKITGLKYRQIYYYIKYKNGIGPNGEKYQYIKKYKGGNKWKKLQQKN